MPITLTPGQPLDHIGPGLQLALHSDFVGPLPIASYWDLVVSSQPEGVGLLWHERWTTSSTTDLHWYLSDPSRLYNQGTGAVAGGTTIYVTAELHSPTALLDTGSISKPFDATAGLGQQADLIATHQQQQSGGFTDADRQQLELVANTTTTIDQSTHATIQSATGSTTVGLGALWSWITRDLWSFRDLSGGETCDRIDHDASLSSLFSVTVTISQWPDDLIFKTPDGRWSFRDLAVITFERNGDVLERHGIHTLSHTVSPLPGSLWFGVSGVNAPVQPTGYHIIVDWAEGVCGTLSGSVAPA